MYKCNILTFLIFIGITIMTATSTDVWHRAGRITGLFLNRCFQNNETKSPEHPGQVYNILQQCLRRRVLKVLDKAIEEDVIEVVDGIELVKYKEANFTNPDRRLTISRRFNNANDWKDHYITALAQLFDTHILKIRLKSLKVTADEGRGRRRQNMFSQLLMFGIIAAAFIVIPMGFQFLAILGGKALLLAKMALLLTSIQGLKKIATSNVNYGLYSTYGVGHHAQPCKKFDYDGYDQGILGDVFAYFDVESLRGGGFGYFDGRLECLGQYDRQWPLEGGEGRVPNYGSYEGYDYLHPRSDVLQE